MPLKLILGPPNSGRAGVVRRRYLDALERDPVLVVPTVDDVFAFERELCGEGAALGGTVLTFGALFGQIATAAGSPPGAVLSPAQRRRCVEVAVEGLTGRLGPLRRSAGRPGFAAAFARLLDELQAAGVGPREVEASAGTLEGSAYLADVATLFAGYDAARERSGRLDAAGIAREAIALLRADPGPWAGRPVFLYGLDDLTPAQFDLVEALAAGTEVTVALPFEPGNEALAARGRLLGQLRDRLGVVEEETLPADPGNTQSAQLYALARSFGFPERPPQPLPERSDLTFLRSAGTRAEAEAIAAEVSRLVHDGVPPDEIAVALRDPGRRGPEVEATLEANGIATALEAEVPVAMTSVGGAVIALLETAFGTGRAADLLRYLRGPSGFSPGRVDWLERAIRRERIEDAEAALARWRGEARGGDRHGADDVREAPGEDPRDLTRLREATAESPASLCAAVAGLAGTMASRPFRTGEDGPRLGPGDGLELRAAGSIAAALSDLAALGPLAPAPERLAETVRALDFRVWSGPVEGRVRIASPYRLRAARFDHLLVGSLQDGEFPRRDRGGDPFLSEAQREQLGLDPRRDTEAEERYLFAVCLALPRRRLVLSYRDSDENGAAESRSPLVEEVRATIAPPPPADGGADPVEAAITRERGLADVVAPLAEVPSADELARALAAHGPSADTRALLAAVGIDASSAHQVRSHFSPDSGDKCERTGGGELTAALEDRLRRARRAEHASRAPGPLSNPAVLAALAAVDAYGGTTLEGFDECSYRWFAGHELDPQPLDPVPDPLVQGGLIHAVLECLYRERPGGDPLPRPASLDAWIDRGRTLLAEQLAEAEVGGHPAERAMARRVERLLERYLGEEAARETGGFEPWLLEARFGIGEAAERPSLDLGGWGLHGAIDRVDRAPDGRALVHDYKLAAGVTARDKFEERAKLQLPLYLIAAQIHWGAVPVGGIYHPLRGTANRRPRGVVAASSAGDLSGYGLYRGDVVEDEELEELLAQTRERAEAIVGRIRAGEIRRDPGPREGLRGHDVCPTWCSFAPICRRDRAPSYVEQEENEAGWDR
ncbi:MAG TPA: PD-(D/E)XK nuclease family protein [Solirubrobacterales bacterium]|nr:PD-(D/E)XK nuclease family protein [Solirubrobacterales bacterium]